jgi:1-aminocyclopropane-1-carboxylate deaminase/D-cysteine desulfhydrase-like pyridoxal-dependent ACC family enzyme
MLPSLSSLPSIPLGASPSPVESLDNLRDVLDSDARLLVKRDDTIGFAFGGNKVRKMRLVAAQAKAAGADTLITTGSVQSNHARVTAAAAVKLGMKCVLVVNGTRPSHPTANALLDQLLGAEVRYVRSREDRAMEMDRAARDVRLRGRTPFIIPLGASTPLGAAAFVAAIAELADQIDPPDVIVHASSSGGTQAGLVAGCALAGWHTNVVGISADEPAASLAATVRELLKGLTELLDCEPDRFASTSVIVDDGFVGEGYGIPTVASREAVDLAATTEALFVDHTYTAKALAGLISRIRNRTFNKGSTVLFWHTGGQVGLFA